MVLGIGRMLDRHRWLTGAAALVVLPALARADQPKPWYGYAGDAQHTAAAPAAADPLNMIGWHTHVDLQQTKSGGELLIHYGSPVITSDNTIIVPQKSGAFDGFQLTAYNASTAFNPTPSTDPASLYTLTTNYSVAYAAGNWVPSFSPTLAPGNKLYYPDAGGVVNYVANASTGASPTPYAFYGAVVTPTDAARIAIDTPLTSDASGNIYFGYKVSGAGIATSKRQNAHQRHRPHRWNDPRGNVRFRRGRGQQRHHADGHPDGLQCRPGHQRRRVEGL